MMSLSLALSRHGKEMDISFRKPFRDDGIQNASDKRTQKMANKGSILTFPSPKSGGVEGCLSLKMISNLTHIEVNVMSV